MNYMSKNNGVQAVNEHFAVLIRLYLSIKHRVGIGCIYYM